SAPRRKSTTAATGAGATRAEASAVATSWATRVRQPRRSSAAASVAAKRSSSSTSRTLRASAAIGEQLVEGQEDVRLHASRGACHERGRAAQALQRRARQQQPEPKASLRG